MRITILDGGGAADTAWNDYLGTLVQALQQGGHLVKHHILRSIDLRYCTGCFGCWVKTPGACVVQDDSLVLCQSIIESDFTLWAAPLRMGYPSTLLKQAMDKSIPLLHPYIVLDNSEAHHRARYARYPRLGLLVMSEATTTQRDMDIVRDLFGRMALNMKSGLFMFETTATAPATVAAEMVDMQRTALPLPTVPSATRGGSMPPPHHLTIFNGSPRGRKGNTPIMLDKVAAGFTAAGGETSILHLNRMHDSKAFTTAFAKAEAVLVGFPLYIDAMPALVKRFFEDLEPLAGRNGNPPLAFLIQSGFPETRQLRHVERYLERMAERLGCTYLGTLAKGGCERVHEMPPATNRSLFATLQALGRDLAIDGRFSPANLHTLAPREACPTYLTPLYHVLTHTPLLRDYWDGMLKQNGAFARRFAQPFAPEASGAKK